jgi:hypothetical protein
VQKVGKMPVSRAKSVRAAGWAKTQAMGVGMSKRGKEKSKPSRMTPELLAELIAVHSQCVHDQRGRCALTVFVRSLCWEINQAMGTGDDEDNGFRRVDETCAARPLGRNRFEEG